MRAVIMQPTYLPWMGYFGLMDLADTFIFYDDVQFSKQSWHHRNRVRLTDGRMEWLTVPFLREGLDTEIQKTLVNNTFNWQRKHWQTIYHSYCKAPFFKRYEKEIEAFYLAKWENLCDMNIHIIKTLAMLIGIDEPKMIKSSELSDLSGKKTDRVIEVLEKIQADEYISTEGTKVYLDTRVFMEKNIKLFWHQYKHPVYPQIGEEFVPYMCVLDLLFNTGSDSLKYIREGNKDALEKAT